MTTNVAIRTAERRTLVVPNAAVQRDRDERFVYVDQRGTLVKRAIATGARDAGVTEITKGLQPGERVRVDLAAQPAGAQR